MALCSKLSVADALVLGLESPVEFMFLILRRFHRRYFLGARSALGTTAEADDNSETAETQAIQVLLGIFHVFMWYFLLIMYMGQIKGVFGTYEPLTYKTGCPLWGIIFIITGIFLIKIARHTTPRLIACALILHVFCIIVTVVAITLTILELSSFDSVSYRNYGQAKLGREVSRILLSSYSLESAIALTYCIFGCIDLGRSNEDALSTVTVEAESSF